MGVIRMVENCATNSNNKPDETTRIADCGQLEGDGE